MGLIMILNIYIQAFFMILLSLFGLSYFGSESSPIYIVTVLGLDMISISYVIYYESQHYSNAKGSAFPYLIPFIFVILYFIEELMFGLSWHKFEMISNVRYILAFSASAIFIATFCYRYNKIHLILKNIDILAIVCIIALIISIPSMYGYNGSAIMGGANHQGISYTSAFCFMVFLLRSRESVANSAYCYKFTQTKIYRVVSPILAIFAAVICLIGGGRGGVMLLIVNSLIVIYIYSRKNFIRNCLLISLGVGAFIYISSNITLWGINEKFEMGLERSFKFLGGDHIDLGEGASGRDRVYEAAEDIISDSPIIGHGIFNQYFLIYNRVEQPYVHNIFLELCAQGGIILLLIAIAVITKAIFRIIRLVNVSNLNLMLIPLATYPITMLMFSGTYITSSSFWFIIVYVLGAKQYSYRSISRKFNSTNTSSHPKGFYHKEGSNVD